MHRLFGLSRDPFAPGYDAELYWESPQRAGVRERVTRALVRGRGAWLRGAPGAGRETLLARVAEDLALAGRPVLWAGAQAPQGGQALLDLLLGVAGVQVPGGDEIDRAAALYPALLEGFRRGGAVLVVLGSALGEGAGVELEILAQLQVAHKTLITPFLWGDGEPPVDGLAPVDLPSFSDAELRACLTHRVAVCGRPDLFAKPELEALVQDVEGVGEVLQRGREALLRKAFAGHGPAGGGANELRVAPVLDRAALEEVDHLLATLGPG